MNEGLLEIVNSECQPDQSGHLYTVYKGLHSCSTDLCYILEFIKDSSGLDKIEQNLMCKLIWNYIYIYICEGYPDKRKKK